MDEMALRRIAAQTGLGSKFLSKDVYLSQMLAMLEKRLDGRCVLKGGTAIVRGGHLDAPRFSEDVDIDVHTFDPKRDIADEFKVILSEMDPFDIEPPRIHRMFIRFDARYRNHFDEMDRIKIEIAPKDPLHLTFTNPIETSLTSPFTEDVSADLLTYSREDMLAMKIMAISGRQNGKDPFDIRGMWRRGVDEDTVMLTLFKLVACDGSDVHEVIRGAQDSLEWMAENTMEIMNIASHYIPRSGRPDWSALFQDVLTIIRRLDEAVP